MPRLSIGQILEATGGTLLRGDPEACVDSFEIDTRRVREGGLFFALKGEKTDGHKFLDQAAGRGAFAAIVTQDVPEQQKAPPALVRVEDGFEALTRCGRAARNAMTRTTVIAVTGSTGKTTTKDLVAAGLSVSRKVHKTGGNFNNHLGVPLTLLACPDDADVAVVEIAMSGPGEIAALARLSKPDFALLTNVSPVHLASFESLDDVAAAKGELFAVLPGDRTSVVNLDDTHVRLQSMRHSGPRVTYGRAEQAEVKLENLEDRFVPGTGLTIRCGDLSHRFNLRLGGGHSAMNALAALAVVHAVGADIDAAGNAMERFEAGPGRGRLIELPFGAVVIDDSYNSNPAALSSVLQTLKATRTEGRKILVLGDMLELGKDEERFHKVAGQEAAAAGADLLIGVGHLVRHSLETARRAGVAETHLASDAGSAAKYLSGKLRSGDLVLVKGSRSIRLDRLVQRLVEKRQEAS
jgi:UDP-N-acetylmuramoyl-tripeptide--D-alanyl-D-alanine ligase